MHPFVAFDVEIAARRPLRVCAVGAAYFVDGAELASLESLVRVDSPVHYRSIHGLSAEDLAAAPAWPDVWRKLRPILNHGADVVAFRAAFDRGALLATLAQHSLRAPQLNFVCVAHLAEQRLGKRLRLHEYLDKLRIPFPGTPHTPLADARAAAALYLALLR